MKALVVDDNACLRELYRILLQDLDVESDAAPDGKVAYQMMQQADYDVIISDMDMPALNGMELYRLVHRNKPYLAGRFVFATGEALDGKYEHFFQEIDCPVLTKPFSLSALKDSIESIA
jgi:CheY-like chemotaxis protein